MRWAVVYHPDQIVKGRLVQPPRTIPEDSVATAQGHGWVVLATDSACMPDVADVNVQMNPRRVAEPGDDL